MTGDGEADDSAADDDDVVLRLVERANGDGSPPDPETRRMVEGETSRGWLGFKGEARI